MFITWLVVALLVQAADLIGVIGLLDSALTDADFRDLGRALAAAIIWVPYFMVSKRVKNTFVR